MEYDNIDEVAKREACERVKQIVKAIKAIKIKYYLNFSKISIKDKERYQKLEINLEKVSNSYNLNNLKVALMQELKRYDGKSPEELKEEKQPGQDPILEACYGAIDSLKEAVSKGKITQARRCQDQLENYTKELSEKELKDVINYKREKLAELMQTREMIEEQVETWQNNLKEMYKTNHILERKQVLEEIKNEQNKENHIKNEAQEEMVIV